jgi:hypothetical protein
MWRVNPEVSFSRARQGIRDSRCLRLSVGVAINGGGYRFEMSAHNHSDMVWLSYTFRYHCNKSVIYAATRLPFERIRYLQATYRYYSIGIVGAAMPNRHSGTMPQVASNMFLSGIRKFNSPMPTFSVCYRHWKCRQFLPGLVPDIYHTDISFYISIRSKNAPPHRNIPLWFYKIAH